MGAYLSAPSIDKKSDDFSSSEKFSYGASRMQGWRISMEDAHNCVPKLEDNMSLFGVYDGHGGSEVALYCALHFADVLKDLQNYKDGKFDDALKEAFMLIDKVLLKPETIRELKILGDRDLDAGPITEAEMKVAESQQQEEEECEEDEMELLHEEATMSIEELLARYGKAANETKAKLEEQKAKIEEEKEGGVGSSSSLSTIVEKKETPSSTEGAEVSSSSDTSREAASAVECASSTTASEGITSTSDETVGSQVVSTTDATPKSDAEASSANEVSSSTSEIKVKSEESAKSGLTTKSSISDDAAVSSSSSSTAADTGGSETDKKASGEPEGSNKKCHPKSTAGKVKSSGKIQPKIKGVKLGVGDDEDFNPGSGSESEESEEGFDSDESVAGSSEEEDEEDEEEEEDMDMVKIPSLSSIAATSEEPGRDSGTTAVVALLNNYELTVANAGDSRCVLCRDGEAFDMSNDHKPEDDCEIKRIKAAGGHVNMQGRVNGGLNLSRAIGDHCYKTNTSLELENQMISAMPDIKKVSLRSGDNFMVLACDGIWNVLSSQDVVNFVLARLPKPDDSKDEIKLSSICEELMDACLAPDTTGDGTGCDNMTCIIIKFNEDWLQKAPENETPEAASTKENLAESKNNGDSANIIEKKAETEVNGKISDLDEAKSVSVKRPRTDTDVEVENSTKKQKVA